ncbi:MAG TPA: FAD-dependent oxidoreductase [Nitrososphaerales archaeon]|nr:FAD-dependent oxidoreductase [Nitrososphaerales archaeon]
MQDFDVIVVGGGNAGLCAAIEAKEHTNRVLMIERSPAEFRGGNSKYTRDVRCAHEKPDEYALGEYSEEEFMEDLLKVTRGETDGELARLVIRESVLFPDWMEKQA